jgi:dihydroneopterin aldolase
MSQFPFLSAANCIVFIAALRGFLFLGAMVKERDLKQTLEINI